MLDTNQQHRHSGMSGDGEKVRFRDLEGVQYQNWIICDIWGQYGPIAGPGAPADATFRDIIYPGRNGELQQFYDTTTNIILAGLLACACKYTLKTSLYDTNHLNLLNGSTIRIKSGEVVQIATRLNFSTATLRLSTTGGSIRYLNGNTLDFTQANHSATFINASTQPLEVKFQYADTGGNLPIFGFSLKVE